MTQMSADEAEKVLLGASRVEVRQALRDDFDELLDWGWSLPIYNGWSCEAAAKEMKWDTTNGGPYTMRPQKSWVRDILHTDVLWSFAYKGIALDGLVTYLLVHDGHEGLKQRARIVNLTTEQSNIEEARIRIAQRVLAKSQSTQPKVSPVTTALNVPNEIANVVNTIMSANKLPTIADIQAMIDNATQEADTLRGQIATLRAQAPKAAPVAIVANGTIPNGKSVQKSAADVFANVGWGPTTLKSIKDIMIDTMEWDAPHPHVPAIDPDYILRADLVIRILFGMVTGTPVYLTGDTGTGKSTLVEQIAARTGFPTFRVNFDSEVTRMDLIGRDTLDASSGVTITKFVDGILPQALGQPCYLILDELDAVKPDIAYVLQRTLEENGLLITEDAGRLVAPHPLFRIFATGNSTGQGDERGIYQGVRAQSAALMDRFKNFVTVPYLEAGQLGELINKKVPGLDAQFVKELVSYTTEHQRGVKSGDIMTPISPRAVLTVAQKWAFYGALPVKIRLKLVLESTLYDRASAADKRTMQGIADRVFTVK